MSRTFMLFLSALLLGACEQPPQVDVVQISVVFTRDEAPYAVSREVPVEADKLTAAFEHLLRGPTDEERAIGIDSWFSGNTAGMLKRAAVGEEGHAVIDFVDFRRTIPGASSSAGSRVLLNELTGTAAQFELIRSVEYQLDGSCHRFWIFLQRGCGIVQLDGSGEWVLP